MKMSLSDAVKDEDVVNEIFVSFEQKFNFLKTTPLQSDDKDVYLFAAFVTDNFLFVTMDEDNYNMFREAMRDRQWYGEEEFDDWSELFKESDTFDEWYDKVDDTMGYVSKEKQLEEIFFRLAHVERELKKEKVEELESKLRDFGL